MAFYIGYKSLLTSAFATVTASSEAVGYEKENSYDGFGYDWWKPSATGDSFIKLSFLEAKTADYVSIWGHDLFDNGSGYTVSHSDDDITYTASFVAIIPTDNNTIFKSFTSSAHKYWLIYFFNPINLLLWSEDFSNAVWSLVGTGSITANQAVAPDGTLTADLLTDTDATATSCYFQQDVVVASDTSTYTFSIYLKEGTALETSIQVIAFGGTTVSTTSTITWSTHTVTAGTVSDEGDGWYRLSIPVTNNGTNINLASRILPAGTVAATTGSVYAWGGSTTLSELIFGYQKTEATSNASMPSIAGIQLGDRTEMPHGAEVGFAVPTIAPKVELKTARSESGAFIGGRQLSLGVEGSINFTNIDPAFMRTTLKPFFTHAQTPAVFVMQWDSVTYTDEVILAWLKSEVKSPTYSSPLYMDFSIDYEGTL